MVEGKAASTNKSILDKESEVKNGKLDTPSPLAQPPKCPECTSQRAWKDGLRKTNHRDVQRWLCRDCGYRFSQKQSRDPSEPLQKHSSWSINTASAYSLPRQVCVSAQEAKNLAKVESRTEKRAAGATKTTSTLADIKGKLVEYTWNLKKEAYAESTIKTYSYILKTLLKRGANLFDPENVKDVIAKQVTWGSGRKNNAVKAYTLFLKMQGLSWQAPKYKQSRTLPFIPTEKEIDDLIAGCSKKIGIYLQLLKETATRRGEAFKLKWTDLDLVNRTVRITPEKRSNPRIFRITENLETKLGSLYRTCERVFDYKHVHYLDKTFRKQRKRIAHKLGNPRLLQIHFHTLRHWKATMEYYRTKDILHVMQFLGHRKIKNTLIYVQLVKVIFQEVDEQYLCKVARNAQEATELIELGFEYVTGEYHDGGKLFRKKKLLYLKPTVQ